MEYGAIYPTDAGTEMDVSDIALLRSSSNQYKPSGRFNSFKDEFINTSSPIS